MREQAVNEALGDRWARVAISYAAEPGTLTVARAIEAVGAVDTAGALGRGDLARDSNARAALADLDLDAVRRALDRGGVRVLVPGDPEWPDEVDQLLAPPACLYVRGDTDLASVAERSVALVGARAATAYGTQVAGDLAAGVGERGFAVVSGAAFGIDAAAHRGALAADATTVAVLACGVDRAYPSAHADLIESIVEHGAVISEVPLGWAPYRSRFLSRNRIIAALSSATVIVEAALRSGALNTAAQARQLGRPVGAVPGPITSPASSGCHHLLRETDAVLVTDPAEVAEIAGEIGADLAPRRPEGQARPGDGLDPVAYTVFSAVPARGAASVERLCRATSLGAAALLGRLAELEVEGLVTRAEDGWRKVRSG